MSNFNNGYLEVLGENGISLSSCIVTSASTKENNNNGGYEYMGLGDFSLSVSYVTEEPMAERVIFNGRRTIVFWSDGTKTVINAREGDEFSQEVGLAMSYVKKFGTGRGDFERLLEQAYVQEQKENKVQK